MQRIIPHKLQSGDEIRVIAPSQSLVTIPKQARDIATKRLEDMGFTVTFGKHVEEVDDFQSSSVASRIEDLHAAFSDKHVKAVLCATGGMNCNQLLRYIDWKLIRQNPKIFCGMSDITALNNSIFTKTSLVNYSGPGFYGFGQKYHFDYTADYFRKCVMEEKPIKILASKEWSDDPWDEDQEKRDQIQNEGHWILHEGSAEGTLVGANMMIFALLKGTEYFPDLQNTILFLEDDFEEDKVHIDCNLQSLLLLNDFSGVKGLVLGRFQKQSDITRRTLEQIIASKKELQHLPIIANVDFGHTDPKITYPVGGKVKMQVSKEHSSIEIIEH